MYCYSRFFVVLREDSARRERWRLYVFIPLAPMKELLCMGEIEHASQGLVKKSIDAIMQQEHLDTYWVFHPGCSSRTLLLQTSLQFEDVNHL